MRFKYLHDPLFLVCVILYVSNRLFLKHTLGIPFLYEYLNDLICIPFFVPIMVYFMRIIKIRRHDTPPTTYEIFIPLFIWSVLFEILLPQSTFWKHWVTGDPYDVVWYSIGACVAAWYWHYSYREPRIITRKERSEVVESVTRQCDSQTA